MAKTGLIVSTYNWPEALNLCLESILNQSTFPDELIIADDGSGQETKQVINDYSEKVAFPVKHIWQEDLGFRKSRALNQSIRESGCDYLIFIDGDIILHPDFVLDHIKNRNPNTFISGSRVLLSSSKTRMCLVSGQIDFPVFSFKMKNSLNGFHSSFLSRLFSKKDSEIYNVRGCNLSIWKDDLILVNGFDEQYEGWGREDSDIVLRLLNGGKIKLRLKFAAVGYHLFHKELDRRSMNKNDQILNEAVSRKAIKAKIGLTRSI